MDDGFFFVKVGEICRRSVVTCTPEERSLDVAARMREHNISGVVVARDGQPLGVITDRDFRNGLERIAAANSLPAGELMSSQIRTIGEDEAVFEAMYRMARHRIHRLVVVDGDGRLSGIVTDTDVLKLQTTTPLYFGREIDEARSLEELGHINAKAVEVVAYARRARARTVDIVRLISQFNDSISQKLIELLLRDGPAAATDEFAFLALGSEGRKEQTLKTDQDNAIVYADSLRPAELAWLEGFSVRLIEGLIRIGVPPCPGGTMANSPSWRRSLSDWTRLVESWILTPRPDQMVNFGMFCDLRTIHGRPEYERELKDVIRRSVERNSLFLAYMARNMLRFPPPLGWFRRIKVERSGEHKGMLDLKKAGIFALKEGVSLLALSAGILDGSTQEKIQALKAKGVFPARELDDVARAFNFLSYLRLGHQLDQIEKGEKPDNYVKPAYLSNADRMRLEEALATIGSLQRHIRSEYTLSLIPH